MHTEMRAIKERPRPAAAMIPHPYIYSPLSVLLLVSHVESQRRVAAVVAARRTRAGRPQRGRTNQCEERPNRQSTTRHQFNRSSVHLQSYALLTQSASPCLLRGAAHIDAQPQVGHIGGAQGQACQRSLQARRTRSQAY